jgi:exonuclease III
MKKELRIGTWNVLTLYKGGALKQLEKVLQNYKMDIIALQEILWIGQCVLEKRNCSVCYCCQKSKHEFGCGFIVN